MAETGWDVCAVHAKARRAMRVPTGTKCQACKRAIAVNDWITDSSTLLAMRHAHCPDGKPREPKHAERQTPLFDEQLESRR